jgi:hypothetical protein
VEEADAQIQRLCCPAKEINGTVEFEYGLKESDMDPIHKWSKDAKCGIRISFDMWKFKTPEEMTMFLLKWS